jgi:hypothetical protein
MVTRPNTTTTKSTPSTTRPTLSYKGGGSYEKPMQKGGSSCGKPLTGGASKKHTHKSTKKTKKTKKSKKPMPKGFAYCLICGKQTEMLNPSTRTTKNGRQQLVGEGKCGHKVYRFI